MPGFPDEVAILMCRFFGVISQSPVKGGEYLLETDWSLAIQSAADPENPQPDGWGLGYYDRANAVLVKSPGFLAQERNRAKALVSDIQGTILLGHIRRASNPRNLPKTDLIGLEHSQPFGKGRHLFVHNGTLAIPDAVGQHLSPVYQRMIQGKNDSEALYALLMQSLEEQNHNVPQAFQKTLGTLRNIYRDLPESLRPKYPYQGLNILYSDGMKLYGLCCYPAGSTHRALCQDRPFFQMAALALDHRIILASEPLFPHSDWQDLSNGDLVECCVDPVLHISVVSHMAHD